MTEQIREETAFLQEAGQALSEAGRLAKEEERLKEEEAKTLRELKTGEKALKDEIDSTLRKRLKELTGTHDAEDSSAKKAEMLNAFRKQKIPAYYTTRLYYALHYPHKPADLLVLLLFVGLCFIAVPCGIYFLALPENLRSPVLLAVIYVLSVLIFGGLYTWIGNSSKSKYTDMLRMGKETWDDLAANQKQVRKLTRQIRRDKDEERYNLGAYDDEIARASQAVQEAEARKQEALTNFDTVTKNIITDELTQNSSEKIGRLMSAHDEALRLLQEVGEEKRQKEKTLQEQYEVRLGREFMSEEKIEALSDILTRGSASSLADAMTEYRTGRDNKEK